jgi:hypothetical protein
MCLAAVLLRHIPGPGLLGLELIERLALESNVQRHRLSRFSCHDRTVPPALASYVRYFKILICIIGLGTFANKPNIFSSSQQANWSYLTFLSSV